MKPKKKIIDFDKEFEGCATPLDCMLRSHELGIAVESVDYIMVRFNMSGNELADIWRDEYLKKEYIHL